jgi:hypothetical protein
MRISVRDLPLDARLLDALPEAKRKAFADLDLAGTLAADANLFFDPLARPGGLMSWVAEVGWREGTLDVGIALKELDAVIDAHGAWEPARQPTPDMEGGLRVARATWKGQEIRALTGRYAAGPSLFEVRDLHGRFLGGIATGGFYAFSEAPRVFGATLSLAGGRLERWAEARYSGKRRAAGLIEGELTIAGSAAEGGVPAQLKGEGELRAREAHLYELPLFAGLFNVMSGELPSRPVFDDAFAELSLDGKRLVVDRAEISSAALSLYGKGAIEDGEADLAFVPEIGRSWISAIPVVGRFWNFVKGSVLVEIEVEGPLDEPRVTATPLKMLTDPARWLLERRKPRAEKPPG